MRLLFLLLPIVGGYNVLVYSSKYAFSHMNYLGRIADTLKEAGHHVLVLQPERDERIRGSGCELAEVLYVEEDDETREAMSFFKGDLFKNTWTHSTRDPRYILPMGKRLADGADAAMKNVLKRKDLMQKLRDMKFDVGIFEMFDYGGLPILYELNLTTIGVQSTVLSDRASYALGVPLTPSYVPGLISTAGDDGSFLSRVVNCFTFFFNWEFEGLLQSKAQEYMTKYHPEAPSIKEMIGNMPFVFTNAEPFTDYAKPTLHKVVDLGGIGLKTVKKLDEKWHKTLSIRQQNVLISFGSMAPSVQMPDTFKKTIISVAKKFPDVTFIWKYEKPEDDIAKDAPNVILSDWTPQGELLASGEIDLFITHGGAGSLMESAYDGIPLVVIPLFGDQTRNALMVERFGNGVFLDKTSLSSPEIVEAAISRGLTDASVKEAATKAKEILKMKPLSAKELLLRHMDLIVKFGTIPSLSPSGRNLNIVQYYNLDILVSIVIVALSVIGLIYKAVRMVFRRKAKVE